jgi:hypothetical protein
MLIAVGALFVFVILMSCVRNNIEGFDDWHPSKSFEKKLTEIEAKIIMFEKQLDGLQRHHKNTSKQSNYTLNDVISISPIYVIDIYKDR